MCQCKEILAQYSSSEHACVLVSARNCPTSETCPPPKKFVIPVDGISREEAAQRLKELMELYKETTLI